MHFKSVISVEIEEMMGISNPQEFFCREVVDAVGEIMEPYDENTENPDYLCFDDDTDRLKEEYESQTESVIRLPQGNIIGVNEPSFGIRYTINGNPAKVFEREAGTLKHMKRTKRAKKMKVIPNYPVKKLYTLDEYAEDMGYAQNEETGKYGFWYNPQAYWDWYAFGGRWPEMFLVKDSCEECIPSYDEIGKNAPSGYIWTCAARKKDVEWDAMRSLAIEKAKECYQELSNIFKTGIKPEKFFATVTEKGIFNYSGELYLKGETEKEYLERLGYKKPRKYPLTLYSLISSEDWMNESYESPEDWDNIVDQFIEDIPDDGVLVGIDYHM